MKCEIVKFKGGGMAIICGSRGRKPKIYQCQICGKRRSTKQCDFPIAGTNKNCDKHLCDECAVIIGRDIDYCPGHPR